jgi:5-methylcytosine-specific restriction endonuclease McrA
MPTKPPMHRTHRSPLRHWLQPREPAAETPYRVACRIRSSAQWQAVREMALNAGPLCRMCNRPATEVHHIQQVSRRPDLAYDLDNLAPLCTEHHLQIESAERRGIDTREILNGKERTKANPYRNPACSR